MTLDMIGPRELSELTNIPVRTITRLAFEGKIPAVKVGRQWRFIREDVERWLHASASNRRHRILVVDDDVDLLELIRLVLSTLGHEVVTVTSGKKALDVLKKDKKFSLLVLDLQMPEVSGADILRWMAKNDVSIATVVFTAYPDSDLMNRAMQFGHFTVLKKPCDPNRIRGAIGAVLDGVGLGTEG